MSFLLVNTEGNLIVRRTSLTKKFALTTVSQVNDVSRKMGLEYGLIDSEYLHVIRPVQIPRYLKALMQQLMRWISGTALIIVQESKNKMKISLYVTTKLWVTEEANLGPRRHLRKNSLWHYLRAFSFQLMSQKVLYLKCCRGLITVSLKDTVPWRFVFL